MIAALALVAASVLGVGRPPDPSAARRQVLAEVAKERAAHLNHDVELLLSNLADDFTSVDHGNVTHPTREQMRQRFKAYFGSVEFRAWDDLAPPVVNVSADGTMATVLIQKLVRTVSKDAANDPKAEISETRFAWLEVWRWSGGAWKNVMIVSTRA